MLLEFAKMYLQCFSEDPDQKQEFEEYMINNL